ncbi:MAG: glycosyl hydrolase family 79 C-terminal domain-containing protein [Solirubrobacteraceae bacterium]
MTVIAFAVVAAWGHIDLADSDQPQFARATVTIAPDAVGSPIPRSYLGVSTEYWTLPLYARHLALFERVLSLLRVPGNGPLVLRVGGDSADHAFWDPRVRILLPWAFTLTPRWTALVSSLARRLGGHLIIDLNLITGSPSTAARWVRAVQARLPRRSIIGFEVGNEPDIYSRAGWMAMTAGRLIAGRALPVGVTAADYIADFRQYASALRRVAPHVPLLGPALANPRAHARWIGSLIASHQPALGIVSAHRYPYSACVPRRSPSFPTIARLLSERATAGMAASLGSAVGYAHRAGLPFRLTELNSITCSGKPGVSDTFATALWAPDALFELLREGVDGVNLHLRAYAINAPFSLTAAGLTARPELYGLVMFARTLGSAPRLLALELRARRSLHLKAWAVRTGAGGLHVLLINKGRRAVRVLLRLPASGTAAIQMLLAPSARSRFGVTLGGQRLGRNGAWYGAPADETVTPTKRGYVVTVPRLSAALLSAHAIATGGGAGRSPGRA